MRELKARLSGNNDYSTPDCPLKYKRVCRFTKGLKVYTCEYIKEYCEDPWMRVVNISCIAKGENDA